MHPNTKAYSKKITYHTTRTFRTMALNLLCAMGTSMSGGTYGPLLRKMYLDE
jgi:hypothetical protein